jgi:hypothetical protein
MFLGLIICNVPGCIVLELREQFKRFISLTKGVVKGVDTAKQDRKPMTCGVSQLSHVFKYSIIYCK